MKRVMIFIDGSNLYHALKHSMGRTQIDFGKFIYKLTGPDRELLRAYYYNAPVDQTREPERYKRQQQFFNRLYATPDLEVVLGRLVHRSDGRVIEKGVDVALVVDMITKAYTNQYDVAILVSGDGDFARAIQAVKNTGRKVEVAFFDKCYHLQVAADRFVSLEGTYLDDCWLS